MRILMMAAVAAGFIAVEAGATTLYEPGYAVEQLVNLRGSTHGGIAVDTSGRVYMTDYYRAQTVMWTPGGSPTQFASGGSMNAATVVGGTVYMGSGGQLSSKPVGNPGAPVVTIASIPSHINGITQAPAGWGVHGGKLIVSDYDGIRAVDAGTGSVTTLAGGTSWESVAFTQDGRLMALKYDEGSLYEVAPNGGLTLRRSFAGSQFDGMALHTPTGDMFMYQTSGNYEIWKLTADFTSMTPFANPAFNSSGWFPSPIAFNPEMTALYYVSAPSDCCDQNVWIERITGFSGTLSDGGGSSVPVPAVAGLFVLALAQLHGLRRHG